MDECLQKLNDTLSATTVTILPIITPFFYLEKVLATRLQFVLRFTTIFEYLCSDRSSACVANFGSLRQHNSAPVPYLHYRRRVHGSFDVVITSRLIALRDERRFPTCGEFNSETFARVQHSPTRNFR